MYHIFYTNKKKDPFKYFFITEKGYSNSFTSINDLKNSDIQQYSITNERYFKTFELTKYYCYYDIKDFADYRFLSKVQNLDEF